MSADPRNSVQTPPALAVASPDEFFPAASRWSRAGAGVLLLAFTMLMLLASLLRFDVTVRTQAAIRPAGELRVVQARIDGTVKSVLAAQNQVVSEGDVLAYIDDAGLRRERDRLQTARENAGLRTEQMAAQLAALDRQIQAQTDLLASRRSSAQAQLRLREREQAQLLATTEADAREARAQVSFAREELARYRTLREEGVISEIDLRERETRLSSLEANLQRVEAALEPSAAAVEIAADNIVEERARGEAALAMLIGEREQLLQRMTETRSILDNHEADLAQLEADIASAVIRAPASGVIQELTLRNPGQVVRAGDLIARIAPPSDALQVKAIVAIRDIGRVDVGQRMHMRVSACPYSDYGTLMATVTSISPDAVTPQDASRIYGTAAGMVSGYEVTARADTLVLADDTRICPVQAGMDGRADIVSREETVLRFLLGKARLIADM